jgi:hypothetical protein
MSQLKAGSRRGLPLYWREGQTFVVLRPLVIRKDPRLLERELWFTVSIHSNDITPETPDRRTGMMRTKPGRLTVHPTDT